MALADSSAADAVEPLLITAGELADLLQISKRTIWRLLSAGQLPKPLRIGGVVRWRLAEIERWIASGCPELSRS